MKRTVIMLIIFEQGKFKISRHKGGRSYIFKLGHFMIRITIELLDLELIEMRMGSEFIFLLHTNLRLSNSNSY